MRIYTKTVISLETSEVVESDSFEYEGPVALAKGGGDTTSNTVAQPPDFQIPYIKNVLEAAQNQYNAGPNEFFPGATVAPFNPTLSQGFDQTLAAGQQAGQTAQGANQALQFQLGAGADPRSNPFFQGTLDAITGNAVKGLQEALPAIDAGAISAGQFGGSRQGVAQGQAFDTFSQNLIDRLTAFGSNAYNTGQETQSRAIALAPSTASSFFLPSQATTQVGQALQGYDQAVIDEAVARFNFGQTADDQALAQYAALVGNPIGTSTSTTTQGPSQNPYLSVLGGALAGGSLGAAIPGFGAGAGAGVAGLLGPAGIAGAGIGAALGLFG